MALTEAQKLAIDKEVEELWNSPEFQRKLVLAECARRRTPEALAEEQAKYNAEEKAKWKAIRRKDFYERTGSWSPVSHYVELWACLGIPIVTKLLGWW